MPKRSSKRPTGDINETAFRVVQQATGETTEKNPAAVALGRLGGLKGGRARADKLSQRRRSAIARKAAKKRWSKNGKR